MSEQTRKFFCAWEQRATPHTISTAENGDVVLRCATKGCGHTHRVGADLADRLGEESQLYADANLGTHPPVLPSTEDDSSEE